MCHNGRNAEPIFAGSNSVGSTAKFSANVHFLGNFETILNCERLIRPVQVIRSLLFLLMEERIPNLRPDKMLFRTNRTWSF